MEHGGHFQLVVPVPTNIIEEKHWTTLKSLQRNREILEHYLRALQVRIETIVENGHWEVMTKQFAKCTEACNYSYFGFNKLNWYFFCRNPPWNTQWFKWFKSRKQRINLYQNSIVVSILLMLISLLNKTYIFMSHHFSNTNI